MVGWHHQLNGCESEQAPGDSEGQGGLACCSPWGHKEQHDCGTEQHKLIFIEELTSSLFFFNAPMDVDSLISGSSVFLKSSLNIWNFTEHILLKPGLENYKHYFASVREECNCVVV